MSEILAHVLQSDGDVVNEPSHLCDYWWRWVACQKRGRCAECTRDVGERKAALYAQACAIWREA